MNFDRVRDVVILLTQTVSVTLVLIVAVAAFLMILSWRLERKHGR